MRNLWKKLLATTVCLAMVLTLVPAVSADSGLNNETPEDHLSPQQVEEEPDAMAWELSEAVDDPDDKVFDVFDGEVQDDPDKDSIEGIILMSDDGQEVRKPKIGVDSICLEEQPTVEKDVEANEASKGNVYTNPMGLGWNQYDITAGSTTYRAFVPSESGTYRFYTLDDTIDTVGYLQNSSKTQIDYNDDGGYGSNFMITYDMTAGTTYYVGARYYDDSKTGTLFVYAELYNESSDALGGGVSVFYIETGGETLYRAFTPSVSGMYRIYSVVNNDTYLTVANSSGQVYGSDDDSGYNTNFQGDYSFVAGTTYYIGAKFYGASVTGPITVSIERQDNQSNALTLGLNTISVEDAGTTVYRYFMAPKSGYYWIYTAAQCSNGEPELFDTVGMIANADMKVYAIDDDGGYQCFHKLWVELAQGDLIYIGTRFYSSYASGTIPLLIEYPYVPENALQLNRNTVTVDDPGGIFYDTFTPTETGVYRVYTQGDYDTFGTLMNNSWEVILFDDDTASGKNFRYDYLMEAGTTYYIGYRLVDTSQTGEFTIRILLQKKQFDGTIEWDPNDVQFKGTTPYVVYNGAAFTPRFTVRDKDGNVVDTSNYTYEYRENRNAGTGYVIVTFTNVYTGTAQAWFKIYLPATTNTYVENTADGIKVIWNPVEGAAGYVIYRRAWNTSSSGWTAFSRWDNVTETTYLDGHDDSHKVYAGTRYQYGVKAYFKQRTDPVTGATIGGNVGDNYNLGEVGPLKTTVRITTRELTKLVAGSGKITAYWSPSKNFTGYQIQRATDADFTKNVKTVKITDPTKSSTALGSLTNGTLYYVRIRSYHEFEGMTYFGGWSNVLFVKPGSGQTVTPSSATYRALCIGQNYTGSSNQLNGCINDMNALAGMLSGLTNSFNVTKLKDASKTKILNGITSAFAGAKETDVSVFTYSGHGTDAGGSGSYQGALCSFESDGSIGYITLNELATALSKVPGRVIVFLDSCHSGSAIKGNGNADEELEAFNQAAVEAFSGYWLEDEDVPEGAKMGEFKKSKFIVIAAAAYDESSWDGYYDGSGYAQGAFTSAVVKGMASTYPNGTYNGKAMPADKNSDKLITLKELFDYAYQTAYNSTSGTGTPQHAQYYGTDSEILFRRK